MKYNAKYRFVVLLAVLIAPAITFAGDAQNVLFDKANALYAKGEYKRALEVYQQLTGEGYNSAAVYFNMGNASYKSGEIAPAVLYLEKAHKLAPADEDINYNLKYVNLKTVDKIVPLPEFFITRWWHAFILSFSTGALAAWSIVFVLCGSVVLAFYFFAASVIAKRASFYAAISLFFLGLLTLFAANRQQAYLNDTPGAVVFSGAANVKSAPVNNSNTLFIVHEGTKVEILDSANGWTKISVANGNEGWIKSSDIKNI